MVGFNTSAPVNLPGPPSISLVDSLKRVALQHPEVAHDRKLNTPEAIETLREAMEEAVQSWKAKRHEQSVSGGRNNRGMLAAALARTDVAQQRSSSMPRTLPTVPKDHLTSDLARKLFPSEEQTPVTDQRRGTFPWDSTNSSRREASSSVGPADPARISVRHLEPHSPKVPSPLSQSPHRQTQEGGPGRDEDEYVLSPVARKARNNDQPTTVRKRQHKGGGWRTKPPARG